MTASDEQIISQACKNREVIAKSMLAKYPHANIQRHKYGIRVIYYDAYFSNNKININKRSREIHQTDFSLDKYYLTEQEAVNAIGVHVPAAIEKFRSCLSALNKLTESLSFEVSYRIECDDDTHCFDYPCINFEMGGFNFTFRIPE